jgi:hypothetical protein
MAVNKKMGGHSQSANDFLKPYAPTIGAATNIGTSRAYNDGAISVAFTPTGPNAATSYTVTAVEDASKTATGSSSPIIVTGLASNTSYTFKVAGTNAVGTGDQSSASSAVTATTLAQTPTIGTATNVGTGRPYNNGAATVTFTANATGGSAITGYTVTSSPGGYTATGSSSPLTVTGLQSATAYTFTVTATNANGVSTSSSASNSITATTVPQAPSAPSASSPSAGVDAISWSAPANGGSGITNYHWESNDAKSGDTGTGTSTNVNQEQGTAQAYRVYATNANGNSDWSSYSGTVTTTFSFAPFSFAPFGAFGAFGFSPFGAFGAFGFSPFGAFGFSPFGAFAFNTFSLNFNTEVVLSNVPGQPDTTKPAGELQIGDKLKAVDLGANPGDWRTWSTTNELDLSNIVETTIVNIGVHTDNVFIYIDGDLFSRSHWILARKDGITKFVKSNEIDTTWQRYSPEEQTWVDISLVEAIDLEMTKISINCEPYDNFFTKKMLVFDGPEFE